MLATENHELPPNSRYELNILNHLPKTTANTKYRTRLSIGQIKATFTQHMRHASPGKEVGRGNDHR